MTAGSQPSRLPNSVSRLAAGVLVIGVMAILYWRLTNPGDADWAAYQSIYDFDGAWLARTGRDPLFLLLVRTARGVLGPNGYETFRLALFAGFALLAARIAYAMPAERITPVIAAAIMVAAMMLKSLVQIREGLAFILVALSMIAVYGRSVGGWLFCGLMTLLAAFTHFGAAIFLLGWLAASAFHLAPDGVLGGRRLRPILMTLAIVIGVAGALEMFRYARQIEFVAEDFGADTNAIVISGTAKYIYWIVFGAAVTATMAQLLGAARGARKFGYAYATCLGAFLIPMLYAVCLTLVFGRFDLPIVTSAVIRLLWSSLELGLIIIGLRGRANLLTFLVASVLILDESRLYMTGALPTVSL